MKRPSLRGFSLLEVVISIFFVGITIVLGSQMLTLMALSRASKQQALALSIARNEIAVVRAGGYAAVPASGSFADSQLALLPNGTGAIAVTDYNAKTKQVTATVSWQEPSATSTVSLTTLITEVGGL